jgi:TonB-dependent SusC/RagA subfamily outer membrane receptor
MKVFRRWSLVSSSSWLVGTITLFFLTACALKEPVGEGTTPDNESVDIGYGTVEEEHVVGSVATVREDDRSVRQYRTLAQMLQAQVAGVVVQELPGGGFSVRIRGSDSFLGGKEPLFVLDGMVVHGGGRALGGISPHTVESITVLKDAGATAIYGSRGANGVILIKTKRHD